MEIRSLRTFLTVAETGTISQAAARLNCVQSNVTSRIKALEEELQVSLFSRSRKGMALTAAGHLFVDHAQAVLDSQASALAALQDFSSTVRLLRLGSMESTLAIRLPRQIAAFRKTHPQVKLGLRSGPTEELVQLLLAGDIDLAFVGGAYEHPDLDGRVVFSEEMLLVSDLNGLQPRQLQGQPLLVFKPGCSYRDYAQRWMKRAGLAPNEIIELGTLEGILGCVASGVGVTLLPRSVIEQSQHASLLTLHELPDPDRFIDTLALHNRTAPANGAVSAFVETIVADHQSGHGRLN
ncbi:LysR family transcriptional regulator [Rhodovibrionaceae bacterium A322]